MLRAICRCSKSYAVYGTGNSASLVAKRPHLSLPYLLSTAHPNHSCFKTTSTDCDGDGLKISRRDKTPYSREEIIDIVRHMQTLSMLWPSDDKMEAEETQVQYLMSAMRIAEQLKEVDTKGVEPLHSPSEAFPTYLREDETSEEDGRGRDEVMMNSSMTKDGYFIAPPIPASKATR